MDEHILYEFKHDDGYYVSINTLFDWFHCDVHSFNEFQKIIESIYDFTPNQLICEQIAINYEYNGIFYIDISKFHQIYLNTLLNTN